jgi:transcriptional regulator with PAS, ATPase and Fis domain
MQAVLEMAQMAALGEDPVLLTGETGTGKELIARLIHQSSRRRAGPFVPVNCPAIPASLFEREFFGHAKGAYSGADKGQAGVCEAAAGGTLFLDEIGDIPLTLQAKLLRLLQEGTFRLLGDPQERWANLRIIAATNADLEGRITSGRFRQDLYFRLSGFRIGLPPLRKRGEDIEPLVKQFVDEIFGGGVELADLFGSEVLKIFRKSRWPGNVRELRATVRRLTLMALRSGQVTLNNLPPGLRSTVSNLVGVTESGTANLEVHLEWAERERIVQALTVTQGNRTAAARRLGISRNSLYRKMERLGIRIPR